MTSLAFALFVHPTIGGFSCRLSLGRSCWVFHNSDAASFSALITRRLSTNVVACGYEYQTCTINHLKMGRGSMPCRGNKPGIWRLKVYRTLLVSLDAATRKTGEDVRRVYLCADLLWRCWEFIA